MGTFIVKRIFFTIPILLGVAFIVFAIMSLTPGDPGRMILGEQAQQEAIDQLNAEFGFNDPFFLRFGKYIFNIATKFDFGISYRTRNPVFFEIFARFPTTLTLAFWGIVLQSIFGVTIGVISAVKQYSKLDLTITITAMFFACIPVFWFGLMVIYIFALKLRVLPSNGIGSWRHFILPLITMILPSSASVVKLTRSSMLETIRQDYVRTARAKGANERTVIWHHAFENALLPIITSLGLNFNMLLGGAMITESVFALPGLGTALILAIRMKDIPQVMAITIFLAAMFCIVVLVVDIIYAFADPRIRAQYTK